MKRFALLFLVLMLALAALACNVGGSGDDDQADSAGSSSSETDPGSVDADSGDTESDSTGDQPAADEPSGGNDAPSDGMFVNPDRLNSYRSTTTMTPLEGEVLFGIGNTEMEWVRKDQARHTTMFGEDGSVVLETITVGDESWMDMGDGNWIYMPASAGSAGVNPDDYQMSMEDILQDFEGGLDPDGSETINGIKCKRYNIDADFSIELPMPEDSAASAFLPIAMEGHVTGKVWVANEGNLPAVIIRSDTTQELTIKYESREETLVYEEFRELYDINESFTIDLPEGASELEIPTAPGGVTSSEGVEPVETAGLDTLDSYRLVWGSKIETGQAGMDMQVLEEWSRTLNALRLVISMGDMQVSEYVWIDEKIWINLGGNWIAGSEDDVVDMQDGRSDLMNVGDDMVFVGEEMMNGVNCKHYVLDQDLPGMKSHQEVWVLEQSDLPPVVVRAILTLDASGMLTELEGNVTHINQPIDIDMPQ